MSEKTAELIKSIDSHVAALADATDTAAASAAFRAYLDTLSKFHSYSLNNQLLIALQRPTASRVAGFHAWKALGRSVVKGAKGIPIMAPMVGRAKGDEKTAGDDAQKPRVFGFRTVYVFDIADTEGRELTQLTHRAQAAENAAEVMASLMRAAAHFGVPVHLKPLDGSVNGYCAADHIALNESLELTAQCGTLAHELAHYIIHWKDREAANAKGINARELEAEATSYAVMQAFGIPQPSEFYLAVYGATADAVRESLSTIRAAVLAILDAAEAAEVQQESLAA